MNTTYFDTFNEAYRERYKSSLIVIKGILDNPKAPEKYRKYFIESAEFIVKVCKLESELNEQYFKSKSFDELKAINHDLYEGVAEENYRESFANPLKCVDLFGEEMGKILSFMYTKIRNYVTLAFEHKIFSITLFNEIFIELYQNIGKENPKALKQMISNHILQNLDIKIETDILTKFDPKFTYYTDILMNANLSDLKYLFQYGRYIGENEIKSARYILSLPEEKVQKMADVFSEGFRIGAKRDNKDLTKKNTINLGYHIGFERVTRLAANNFKEKMGLDPIVYMDPFTAPRPRVISTQPSKQFAYDHRFDEALYFSEEYADAVYKAYGQYMEKHQDLVRSLAGPAVQESFEATSFSPISKKVCLKYSDSQTKIKNKHTTAIGQVLRKYLPRSEYNFVIIAYPLPDLGEKYEQVFEEIIQVNTLDEEVYEKIQNHIIDALDQGEYVHIVGSGDNKTDLNVQLQKINNPTKETNFSNCLADVNIPVGEVFTSPKLKGTDGILHVTEVFLQDLRYENFELQFKDGEVVSYTCSNFDQDEENRNYVHENLLHPHDSLPLGEFAIGTNTTAFMMAKKYGIQDILPILIAEKMGPHFAIGDTCYSWSEDIKVYNPNKKEVIARDNERSILRKTDLDKAYTFKHTDITIPYDELKLIAVVTKDGREIPIIENGRFVLEGTELLNVPFDKKNER